MGIFSAYRYALCQTLLLLCVLCFPATAMQIWEGTGRVISGFGQGGSVKLQLAVDKDMVRSLSGPPLDGKIQINDDLSGVVQTDTGSWKFEKCGKDLCVNLQQHNPEQTIFYRLQPK